MRPPVLVGDVEDEVLPAVPRGVVETLRTTGRHDRLGPPGIEALRRRLGLSVRPAIQERLPARPVRHDVETDVGDVGVAGRVKAVGRGVPESQVLSKVQPSNEGPGTVQDDPEPDGDVDDLEIIAGIVTRACSLEQLELLMEHLEKILVASSDRCRRRSSAVPHHTARLATR